MTPRPASTPPKQRKCCSTTCTPPPSFGHSLDRALRWVATARHRRTRRHPPRPPTRRHPTGPDFRAAVWNWYTASSQWSNHERWPQRRHDPPPAGHATPPRPRDRRPPTNPTGPTSRPTARALEEWRRYSVSGFLDRLKDRLKQHCDGEHGPWPARTRAVAKGDSLNTVEMARGGRSMVCQAFA